jgi:hypothetical protein
MGEQTVMYGRRANGYWLLACSNAVLILCPLGSYAP